MIRRGPLGIAVAFLMLALVAAISVATLRPKPAQPAGETSATQANETEQESSSDTIKLDEQIDPKLIQYHQTAQIATGLPDAHALAVGPQDRIYVGGGKTTRTFSAAGQKLTDMAVEETPRCLAIGGPDHEASGRLYVGMDSHVESYDPEGNRIAAWKSLGDKASLTSLATADHDVFVADAGNRIVWHYDPSGRLLGRIGQPDPARRIRGFVITSRYFDIGLGADGLLYAVNPRALHLEGFTFAGDLELTWGHGGTTIDTFFGCCNPANFAVLPDGRFVTAEKGIARIKIYSPQGKFECVVAGPHEMPAVAADIAADSHGRIVVLDATKSLLRIFEKKSDGAAKP